MNSFGFIFVPNLLSLKGWGNPEHLEKIFNLRKILANKEIGHGLVEDNHPVYITKVRHGYSEEFYCNCTKDAFLYWNCN